VITVKVGPNAKLSSRDHGNGTAFLANLKMAKVWANLIRSVM